MNILYISNVGQLGPLEVISHRKSVTVSDCEERKSNLLDGTGSEWWTDKEVAWIEIDLQSICLVKYIRIQWWGTSVSENYTISMQGQDEKDFVKIRTSDDALETPRKFDSGWSYNGWSRIRGWDKPTKKLRFDLRDGELDPWWHWAYFEIRQINVYGNKLSYISCPYFLSLSTCRIRTCPYFIRASNRKTLPRLFFSQP